MVSTPRLIKVVLLALAAIVAMIAAYVAISLASYGGIFIPAPWYGTGFYVIAAPESVDPYHGHDLHVSPGLQRQYNKTRAHLRFQWRRGRLRAHRFFRGVPLGVGVRQWRPERDIEPQGFLGYCAGPFLLRPA